MEDDQNELLGLPGGANGVALFSQKLEEEKRESGSCFSTP